MIADRVRSRGDLARVPLVWAEGMLGVCPVFATQEQAEAYAGIGQTMEIRYEGECQRAGQEVKA